MTHDIEHEVISSLPLPGVQEVVDLAVEVRGEEAVLEAVAAKLGSGAKLDGISVVDWLKQATSNEDALRSAIADAAVASRKEWFKREDRGEELAGVVIAHLTELAKTHLMTVLNRIRAFVYADESVPTPSDAAEETSRD